MRARKRFGQNFLVDGSAVARIVDALEPLGGRAVFEIGPGRGALTVRLLERAGAVAAIELDRDLAAQLDERFGGRLLLIQGDILGTSLAGVAQRLASSGPLLVIGNLPYNVSKPIAMRLIEQRETFERAVLMFQREVAERLTAAPGGKEFGPLSVLAQEVFRIERLFDLKPGAFRPAPAVTSTVTRWTRRATTLGPRAERDLRAALRAGFSRRRRTVYNNLRAAYGDVAAAAALGELGLPLAERPERVPAEAWRRLSALLSAETPSR